MPHRTIAELSAEGFTQVEVHCVHCRFVKDIPFASLLRGRDPKDATLGEIAAKLRCRRCGNLAASVKPCSPPKQMEYAWGIGHQPPGETES